MAEEIIRIAASCPGNPDCYHDGEDLPIRIDVTNVSGRRIEFPLAYAERSGVFVEIRNPRTDHGVFLRRGVPRTDLLDEKRGIAAGETVVIDWVVTPGDLLSFEPPLDLVARIEVMVPMGGDGNDARAKTILPFRSRPLD